MNRINVKNYGIWSYFIICMILFILAIILLTVVNESTLKSSVTRILNFSAFTLIGMSVAAFSSGVMHSSATFSGKRPNYQLQLGGSIVIVCVIIYIGISFIGVDNSEKTSYPFELNIYKKYGNESEEKNITLDLIAPIQLGEMNLAPVLFNEEEGMYSIKTLIDLSKSKYYHAVITNSLTQAEIGFPGSMKNAVLSFKVDEKNLKANESPEITITLDENLLMSLDNSANNSWFELCDPSEANLLRFSSIIPSAYAQYGGEGILMPNLEYLQKAYKFKKQPFTEFSILIKEKDFKYDRLTYEILIGEVPIYINRKEINVQTREYDDFGRIKFGISLPDSDVNNNQSNTLIVRLNFYDGKELIMSDILKQDFGFILDIDAIEGVSENSSFGYELMGKNYR